MKITSAICTLFEGDYHYGVGALANSLYAHGFRGTIYAGYRGPVPPWVGENKKSEIGNRKSEIWTDYSPAEGLTLRFIPLTTTIHFANYKPDFMRELWETHCPEAEALFYFDPDIVIKCEWFYYEEWVQNSIALVEEIATRGMSYNHPIRRRWLEVAKELNIVCQPVFSQYFNAGFVGVHRSCKAYLDDWSRVISALPNYGVGLSTFMPVNRPHAFCGADQDALNLVAMAAEPHLSTIGPEGMDFIPGGFTMSHAVGGPKPWRKNYLSAAADGIRPSLADKEFWKNFQFPIPVFSNFIVKRRKAVIKIASLIGRFYHR